MDSSYQRKKIYDAILRVGHAVIAFSTLALLLSAWGAKYFYEQGLYSKSLWITHIFTGYLFIIALSLRIIWGFIGSKYALWSEMLKIKLWLQAVKSKSFSFEWDWGHHPQGALGYLFFYILAVALSLTGLFLAGIEHNEGPIKDLFDDMSLQPWLSNFHEFLSWSVVAFLFLHLGALLYHEKKDGLPVLQSIWSGYQYKKNESLTNESKETQNDKLKN
jgi:Ni,Fe-hydrogenase I cytochrome b subunit